MGLSEDFTVRVGNPSLTFSTVRLDENDVLEASDSILQISHLFGFDVVK